MTAVLARREFVQAPLAEWAQIFRDTAEVCAALARTPFVPASLRVIDHGELQEEATAAQVTAAILTGQELGLPPMSALRSIVVINGTPALTALAMRALVQRAGHEVWVHESNKTRAIVRGQRAGSAHVEESLWTLDRAKDLGIAGKANWRLQPIAMLLARATAECCRLVASDVLLGVPYAAEELADVPELDMPAADATVERVPPVPRKRTARRAPTSIETVELPETPPPTDTPSATPVVERVGNPPAVGGGPQTPPRADAATGGEEGSGGSPLGPTPPLINKAQNAAMHAAFNDLKITDREDRLAMTSQIIGRAITSSDELTEAERSRLIDELGLLAARSTEWIPPDDEPFDE